MTQSGLRSLGADDVTDGIFTLISHNKRKSQAETHQDESVFVVSGP